MILILHIFANAVGILIADRLISGITLEGDILTLMTTSAILGIINYFIKPILKIISFPLVMISFGTFGFILNALILWFVTKISPNFAIEGIISLFWATFLISGINIVVSFGAEK